jgi:hemoglobin
MYKSDIQSIEDINNILQAFYKELIPLPEMQPIFADIDLVHHLPRIASFWESVLFGQKVFEGNVMASHLKLNREFNFTSTHFELWLSMLEKQVYKLHHGELSDLMIQRAKEIALLMQHRMGIN